MESKIIYHNNFRYILNNKKKNTSYFRCSKYGSNKCLGRIILKQENILEKGKHTCQNIIEKIKISDENEINSIISLYSKDISLKPGQIYQKFLADFLSNPNNKTILVPSKNTIKKRIEKIRGNRSVKIEEMFENDLGLTKDGHFFLRIFKKTIVLDKVQSFAIWASQEGISVLRQNGTVLIDATFKISPSGFKQCIVIMSYEPATRLYIPCAWCLMTSKSEYMYWFILQELLGLMDWDWEPKVCIVDFEFALIKSIKMQLKKTKVIGCFFHFKQALLKRMKKIGMNEENINKISNDLNFLTILKKKELQKGLSYLEAIYNSTEPKFKKFLNYFKKVWLKKFPFELWNINFKGNKKLITRTNNPLERYNRRLNEQFSTSHPNILKFVYILKNEEEFYSKLSRGIRSGNIRPENERKGFVIPKIPLDFIFFCQNQ